MKIGMLLQFFDAEKNNLKKIYKTIDIVVQEGQDDFCHRQPSVRNTKMLDLDLSSPISTRKTHDLIIRATIQAVKNLCSST